MLASWLLGKWAVPIVTQDQFDFVRLHLEHSP